MKPYLMSCISAFIFCISCERNPIESFMNDSQDPSLQDDVLTQAGIDSVLSLLEEIEYEQLDEDYLNYSHPNRKFTKELEGLSFYKVRGDQLHHKVVGQFTIGDFIVKDGYYEAFKDCPAPDFTQYWLVDKEVLYMMLDLILELDALGHNKYGFKIRTQHRHPTKNTAVKGASYSQHQFGRAIDIKVLDIDNNGKSNQADKTIIYDLLLKIVGNKGGIGRYPGSMNLHFDCRGHKARWDSY